jgi:hypothetical protein
VKGEIGSIFTYIASRALFSRAAICINLVKICQARTNPGVDVELIHRSYDKRFEIFESYGDKQSFRITSTIPFTNTSFGRFGHGL